MSSRLKSESSEKNKKQEMSFSTWIALIPDSLNFLHEDESVQKMRLYEKINSKPSQIQ